MLTIHLHISTTPEQIEEIPKKLREFLRMEPSIPAKDDWAYWVSSIDDLTKISLNFWIEFDEVNWASPLKYLIPK